MPGAGHSATSSARTHSQSSIPPNASTAQLKSNLQAADKAIHQAVDAAPGEIKSDVTVIADSFTKIMGAIAAADYDLTKLPPDALSAFQSPEFANSTARFQAYITNVCRIRS